MQAPNPTLPPALRYCHGVSASAAAASAAIVNLELQPWTVVPVVPWHGKDPKLRHGDAEWMASQEPIKIVLQRDCSPSSGAKEFQLETLPLFLHRVLKPRPLRSAAKDLHLYHDIESFMPVGLIVDLDGKHVTWLQLRAKLAASILDKLCVAFSSQGYSCDRDWFGVYPSGGSKPSMHVILLRGVFAVTVVAMKQFRILQLHFIPTMTVAEAEVFDMAIYRPGAYRDLGMTKMGHERFLAEVPDPLLSGAKAIALAEIQPRWHRLLCIPVVVHPDDLAAAPIVAPCEPTRSTKPCRDSSSKPAAVSDSSTFFTDEGILEQIDTLVAKEHYPRAQRNQAVWKEVEHTLVVRIEYKVAKDDPSREHCFVSGIRHENNNPAVLYRPRNGRVDAACFSDKCRHHPTVVLGFVGPNGVARVTTEAASAPQLTIASPLPRVHDDDDDDDDDGDSSFEAGSEYDTADEVDKAHFADDEDEADLSDLRVRGGGRWRDDHAQRDRPDIQPDVADVHEHSDTDMDSHGDDGRRPDDYVCANRHRCGSVHGAIGRVSDDPGSADVQHDANISDLRQLSDEWRLDRRHLRGGGRWRDDHAQRDRPDIQPDVADVHEHSDTVMDGHGDDGRRPDDYVCANRHRCGSIHGAIGRVSDHT